MTHDEQVRLMTDKVAKFVEYTAKVLPDDVRKKISELQEAEKKPLACAISQTMQKRRFLRRRRSRLRLLPRCATTRSRPSTR